MKKILITGENGYIGNEFKLWINKYKDCYDVEFISLRDSEWRDKSFSEYDVLLHLAAIVHVKENEHQKYYDINRDLTECLVKKARNDGVRQFIFLSTMGVFGMNVKNITKNTVPRPETHYANSKYQAEKLLIKYNNIDFKISILRPPLIYGFGCPGNYKRLKKIALSLPVFPNIDNCRSMIYIDNLSIFLKIVIDNELEGILHPQNDKYVKTKELVRMITRIHGKNILFTSIFNIFVNFGIKYSKNFNKVFGSYVYASDIGDSITKFKSKYNFDHEEISFIDSIKLTEAYRIK